MLTDQELQSLRNMGNESEAAADEIARLREFLAIWISDGSLQTFEHREKFRAAANALLGANAGIQARP